jgi:predicted CoA-binding protein
LVNDFLGQSRIAVVGVSRHAAGHGANVVYKRLRDRGYSVYAVNPNAQTVEDDRCYPNLGAIPADVDGVVIGTAPHRAEAIVRECAELGIRRVWMHRGPGAGSVSLEAAKFCRANAIAVIPGGCPLMFGTTSDFSHRCMRWILQRTGAVPRGI